MKLLVMIFATAAIFGGLLSRHEGVVVLGAAVHLLAGITDLVGAYREAKLLRSGTLKADHTPSVAKRLAEWMGGGITLTGLVLVAATKDSNGSGYAVAGWIIWGGAVAGYIIVGIIARDVGGIPVSMGHGGWAVRRDRKGTFRE